VDLTDDPVLRDWFREACSSKALDREAAFSRLASLGEQQVEVCRLLLGAEASYKALKYSPAAAFEAFYDRAVAVLNRLRRQFPEVIQAVGNLGMEKGPS
jgi:hypothetical protein